MELVQQALEEESDERARAILGQVLAQGPQFSANEVNRLLKKLTLPKAAMHALTASLQEAAALRGLEYELHRAGFSSVRAVAYRDSVYTVLVYGGVSRPSQRGSSARCTGCARPDKHNAQTKRPLL